ncbi:MAG: insulinase family protein [Candidatus Krumholzibacteria bacterium]|nr:insulinase family protein [Candidatus Krumholzibacteria bacterium]
MKLVVGLVAAAGVLAMVRAAAARDVFPFPVFSRVLANGLTVVVVPYDSPGIVTYYSIVRAGSRDEVEPGHSGFAHFFEHMMFRGTERYSTEAYNDLFKALGSDANAYTSDDLTVYHALLGTEGLERVVDAESDRFMNLAYAEADFKQEAKAVLGEYNKNYSNPIRKLFERLREIAYDRHTYKHTTMGFYDDILDMPNQYDYSLSFFERFYTPSNTVILVVGDVDAEAAHALVERYYGRWNRAPYSHTVPEEPAQTAQRSAHIDWDNPTLPYLAVAFKAPAFSTATRDCAALDVLARLVFDETGELYQRLVIREQKVEYLRTYAPDRRDPGLFTVYARIKDEAHVAEVQGAIFAAVDRAAREETPAERLAAVKSHLRYSLAGSLDTARGVAGHLSHFLSLTGDAQTINEAYRRYDEVTAGDVKRVAGTYLTPERSTVVTLTGVHGE